MVVGGGYTTGSTGLAVSEGKAYFNGMTTGSGTQSVRLVIYPDDGSGAPATSPVGVSDPVTVTQSTPAGLDQLLRLDPVRGRTDARCGRELLGGALVGHPNRERGVRDLI